MACEPAGFERDAPPDPCFASEPQRCFVSHEAYVIVTEGVASDAVCVDRAIGRALDYWQAPPDVLARWLVTYEAHELACNGAPASGCCSLRRGTIDLQALDTACPETAQLVHEVGHVVMHDTSHHGSRWCWETEQKATREIVRAPDASAGCASSPYYTWSADLDRGCDGTSEPSP